MLGVCAAGDFAPAFLTTSISPIGAVSRLLFFGLAGASSPRDTRSASARLSSRVSTPKLALSFAALIFRADNSAGSSTKPRTFLKSDMTSRISAGRSLGFLESSFRIKASSSGETLGFKTDVGVGDSLRCFASKSLGFSPANGGAPVTIS